MAGVGMTDPQEDKPCRDCKRPTQHATEICADCRTPAGRLVTALAALGVKAAIDDEHIVSDGEIRGYVAPGGWEIACDDVGDQEDAIEAAANAIAAIVDHAGTIATLAAEVKRLTARVLELEAPGECQSLHKLRARIAELEARLLTHTEATSPAGIGGTSGEMA